MKILILIILSLHLLVAGPVYAFRQAPGTDPLQPVPADTYPNYSGNIQEGEAVEEAQLGNTENFSLEATQDTEVDQNSSPSYLDDVVPNKQNIFPIMFALGIVILSAALAGMYYWYKTRKTK